MTELKDDCYPACRVPRVRFVCLENGTDERCGPGVAPHRREEWAPAGARPRCDTHGLLVKA
jgi:hypothetical protein